MPSITWYASSPRSASSCRFILPNPGIPPLCMKVYRLCWVSSAGGRGGAKAMASAIGKVVWPGHVADARRDEARMRPHHIINIGWLPGDLRVHGQNSPTLLDYQY